MQQWTKEPENLAGQVSRAVGLVLKGFGVVVNVFAFAARIQGHVLLCGIRYSQIREDRRQFVIKVSSMVAATSS